MGRYLVLRLSPTIGVDWRLISHRPSETVEPMAPPEQHFLPGQSGLSCPLLPSIARHDYRRGCSLYSGIGASCHAKSNAANDSRVG